MLVRFVSESIRRAPKRKAMLIVAIALGSTVAASMLGVMLSVGDKINRELRAAGANIVVTPLASLVTGGAGGVTANAAGGSVFIEEARVPDIRRIFWGLNITGFAPSLAAHDGVLQVQGVWFSHLYNDPSGKARTTGIQAVNPAWTVQRGKWARDAKGECMIGNGVVRRTGWKPGDIVTVLGQQCEIAGVLSTGEEVDDRVLMPLAMVQEALDRPGKVDRIDVAALTKPEDDFARKDPRTMTPAELERWSCTNYVSSIAKQIQDVLPGASARPVRRVADSEGKVLDSIGGLMALITLAALISAGLTSWSLTATTMMERRGEIAIMQAIGGARWLVAAMLSLEVGLMGLAGGVIGALAGVSLARVVGEAVFHDPVEISWVLPIVIVLSAVAIALAGAAHPLRRTLRMEPATVLRGGV